MMKLPLFSLSLLALFFTSCASYYSLPEGYTGPTATLKDTATKTGATKARAFRVRQINGKYDSSSPMATPYGGGMGVTLKDSFRKVPAEAPLTLTVAGGDLYAADGAALANMLSGNANKSVVGEVTFTPKTNRVYRVNGLAGKESSSVWIEEENTGKVVTKVITK